LLSQAQDERRKLLPELHQSSNTAAQLESRCDQWTRGWFLRRLFPGRFAGLQQRAQEAADKLAELQEQERLSKIATEFDIPDSLTDSFGHLCDATAKLGLANRIWDTISRQPTDRFLERTTAHSKVSRKPVGFSLGGCELIQCAWKVPQFENANGGEILIYPGFILYRVSDEAFALVDIRDTNFEFSTVRFIEEEAVPPDSRMIGQTWLKANKDGSPDRRFADNRAIPIVEYGNLRLTSTTGLNEEFMVSNVGSALAFDNAWQTFSTEIPPDAA